MTSPCVEWTGRRDSDGYGRVGKGSLAHREAYRAAHPGEPMPEVVRHACDNPPCVNVEHLIPGTHGDNVRDCQERGRHRYAETHHNAKVTDAQVESIRQAYAAGCTTQAALAETYGLTQSAVSRIVNINRRPVPAGALTPRTTL